MANKKNIDRLFQEKLTHLEQQPRPDMWLQIQGKMQQKKKRRFPLLWIYGGAAVLLIGLFLFSFPQKKEDPIHDIPVITETKKKSDPIKSSSEKKEISLPKQDQNQVIVAERKNNDPVINKSDSDLNLHEKEVLKPKVNQTALLSFPLREFDVLSFKNLTLDSIVKTTNEKPKMSLIALVQKEDSITEEDVLQKRWAVLPSFGYSRTSSLSGASSIDARLRNNDVSGDQNSTIGISFSYQITDRWSVRSGVHTQQMSFTTQDIGVVSGVISSGLNNISGNSNTNSNSDLVSGGIFIGNAADAQSIATAFHTTTLITNNGKLQQVLGYTEVPLEFTYRINTKKEYSIGVVSGFSTLFLNKNEVQVQSPEFNALLGKANNLNTVNFSANFGFDFNYSLSKQWLLNLNPMFKVHLNTFSRESNGFQPYFLGVYTGVKYQF